MFRRFIRATAFLAFICPAALAQNTIHVPADQPTIQAGINAANNGDTVLVAPGVYHENLIIDIKEITLRSSDGAATTIIDGSKQGVVITITHTPGLATTIDGFTIRDGATAFTPSDGGIFVQVGGATIQNNTIVGNYGYGVDAQLASVNVFSNHFVTTSPNAGQSYCIAETAISLAGNLNGFTPAVIPDVIKGNLIEGDGSACVGGGILSDSVDSVVIENNVIRNGLFGIWLYVDYATITQNLIYGNEQGGLNLRYELGIFPQTDPAELFIVNNTFFNNLTNLSNVQPTQYGEVMLEGLYGKIALSNNLIVANSSSSPVVVCPDGIGETPVTTPAIFDHNDIFNVSSSPYPVSPMQCGDTEPTEIGLNGNISANPLFASATDFHLLPGSLAIDAGNNSAVDLPVTDLSGGPRIVDATGEGSPIVDMGVYESAGLPDATPTVLSLISSSYYVSPDSSVTLTATPSAAGGAPSGTITFFEDDRLLGSSVVTSGGTTIQPVTFSSPSLHRFTATYTPASGYAPSISTVLYIRVSPYTPKLVMTSTPNPSLFGQTVTFNIKISSPDTNQLGPIILSDSGVTITTLTPDSTGTVSFSTNTLYVGDHYIEANYYGDETHFAAGATVYQQVVSGYTTTTTLSSSLNPSTLNQPVTFTAHLTSTNGTPTGVVIFTDGTSTIGSPQTLDPSGNASVSTSSLTAGTHTITAVYSPTGSFAGSTAALTQTVIGLPNITTLTASPATGYFNTPITLTATVAPTTPGTTPTGSVAFTINGATLATSPLVNGIATYTNTLALGTDQIVANYLGDATYRQTASNTVPVTITAAPTNLTLITPVIAEPALTPFALDARLFLSSGPQAGAGYVIIITVTPLTTGATPAITSALTTDASGTISLPVSLLPGQYSVAATFAGTTALQASTATPVTTTVIPNPTTTTLTASPSPGIQNEPITITATVSATTGTSSPSGSVTITDTTSNGTVTLATVTTSTSAARASAFTLTTSALAPGTHSLTAVFTPAVSFTASQSSPLSLIIAPQSFTLTLSDPTITIQTGHHRPLTVSLTSIGGLTATFTNSCGTLPVDGSCTWGQTTVTLPANGTVATSLTIDTNQLPGFLSSNTRPTNPGTPFAARNAWAATAAFALLPFTLLGFKRRRNLRALLSLLILATLATTLTACGANQYPPSTPPGTYTIPITATATFAGHILTQTVNLTLIVTQ